MKIKIVWRFTAEAYLNNAYRSPFIMRLFLSCVSFFLLISIIIIIIIIIILLYMLILNYDYSSIANFLFATQNTLPHPPEINTSMELNIYGY